MLLLQEPAPKTQTYSRRRYSRSGDRDTDPWNPRKRDIILFFVGMVIVGVLFLVLSSHWRSIGLESISWSAWLLGVILLFVSIGFACLFAIAFFTTDFFIKREIDSRLKRRQEEQRALMQKMYGRTEKRTEEEDDE